MPPSGGADAPERWIANPSSATGALLQAETAWKLPPAAAAVIVRSVLLRHPKPLAFLENVDRIWRRCSQARLIYNRTAVPAKVRNAVSRVRGRALRPAAVSYESPPNALMQQRKAIATVCIAATRRCYNTGLAPCRQFRAVVFWAGPPITPCDAPILGAPRRSNSYFAGHDGQPALGGNLNTPARWRYRVTSR